MLKGGVEALRWTGRGKRNIMNSGGIRAGGYRRIRNHSVGWLGTPKSSKEGSCLKH